MNKKIINKLILKNKENIIFTYSKLLSKQAQKKKNFIYIKKDLNTKEEKEYFNKYSKYIELPNCSVISLNEIINNNDSIFKILKEKNNVLIGYYKSVSWIYRTIQENGYNISILR